MTNNIDFNRVGRLGGHEAKELYRQQDHAVKNGQYLEAARDAVKIPFAADKWRLAHPVQAIEAVLDDIGVTSTVGQSKHSLGRS